MVKSKYVIMCQGLFLVLVFGMVLVFYPRAETSVSGNAVRFSSDADIIIISENPDFSNSRYINLSEVGNASFRLKHGTYYWRADNGIILGGVNEFTIDSEVDLEIDNDSNLINIGNVILNVSENSDGILIGNVILGPGQMEKIENIDETYVGRQVDG